MFGNKSMFGMKMPKFGAKPMPTGPQTQPMGPKATPMGPQTQPGIQPPPQRPGARVAQSLLNMQFNRNPQSPLGAFGGAMDQIVDAYGEKNWKNKFGGYGREEE